jgi:hypothetical protein
MKRNMGGEGGGQGCTMRIVNMTEEDRKPRGCKHMNLQSETRDKGCNRVALSLPPTITLREMARAVIPGVAEQGKAGRRAEARAWATEETCGSGGDDVLKSEGMMHVAPPVESLNTKVAASLDGPKL